MGPIQAAAHSSGPGRRPAATSAPPTAVPSPGHPGPTAGPCHLRHHGHVTGFLTLAILAVGSIVCLAVGIARATARRAWSRRAASLVTYVVLPVVAMGALAWGQDAHQRAEAEMGGAGLNLAGILPAMVVFPSVPAYVVLVVFVGARDLRDRRIGALDAHSRSPRRA